VDRPPGDHDHMLQRPTAPRRVPHRANRGEGRLTSAVHQRQLGEFRLLIAKDGSGGTRPLAELVDDIPSDLRDAQIFMEGGLMVIDTPELRLLLDAGNGPNRGP